MYDCRVLATPGSEIRVGGELYPRGGPAWSLFFEYIGNVLYALFIRRLSTRELAVLVAAAGCGLAAFSVWGHPFSFRYLILLGGGLFLLFMATTELHERLEALPHSEKHGSGRAGFWVVIAQILLLDAVFSLDSIITAVGMVDNLYVMMSAVVIAMIVMIAASRPLTDVVNRHPTVVVLCLSFLLMIGCSLIAEGLGFHIPKGYLYAAISF